MPTHASAHRRRAPLALHLGLALPTTPCPPSHFTRPLPHHRRSSPIITPPALLGLTLPTAVPPSALPSPGRPS